MNDDRIITILQEIRDLQRQHLEAYKEAKTIYQAAARRQVIGFVLAVVATVFLVWALFPR